MKVGELLFELGFNADSMKLNDFIRSIGELNMSSIIAGGSMAGLIDLTKNLLEGTAGLARDMRMFGVETGLSEQRMDSWSKAAEQIGVDGKVVEQSLRRIRDMQSELKTSGRADQGWMAALNMLNSYGKADIDPIKDDAYTQILKMKDAFKNLSQDQQMFVNKSIGFQVQMMDVLKEGKEFWDNIDKHETLSKEDIQSMKELQKEWTKLTQEITIAGEHFALEVAPMMINLITTAYNLIKVVNDSWVGKIAATAGHGWEMIAQRGKDQGMASMLPAQWIAESVALAFMHNDRSPQQSHITFNIQGNNPHEISQHVYRSLKEWISETHYQSPLRHY